MKKFLSLCALLLLASPAFALTITGKVVDGLTNENLQKVAVSIGDESEKTNNKGTFEIDFTPNSENPAKISFELAEYEKLAGEIVYQIPTTDQIRYIKIGEKEITPDFNGDFDLGTIALNPEKKPETVIKGEITIEKLDQLATFEKNVEILVSGSDLPEKLQTQTMECQGKVVCEYEIKGFLGDDKNPRNYSLTFHYGGAEDKVYKDIEENDIKVKEKAKTINFHFKEVSNREQFENNLSAITGFRCNELMPKYLVGANCVENSSLEGDASDVAMWIQRFGGKITGVITILAVAMIIFNAFTIVTSAGDEEKIGNAKKGIMWIVLGLALMMFAYLLVKTIIAFTYTS